MKSEYQFYLNGEDFRTIQKKTNLGMKVTGVVQCCFALVVFVVAMFLEKTESKVAIYFFLLYFILFVGVLIFLIVYHCLIKNWSVMFLHWKMKQIVSIDGNMVTCCATDGMHAYGDSFPIYRKKEDQLGTYLYKNGHEFIFLPRSETEKNTTF